MEQEARRERRGMERRVGRDGKEGGKTGRCAVLKIPLKCLVLSISVAWLLVTEQYLLTLHITTTQNLHSHQSRDHDHVTVVTAYTRT